MSLKPLKNPRTLPPESRHAARALFVSGASPPPNPLYHRDDSVDRPRARDAGELKARAGTGERVVSFVAGKGVLKAWKLLGRSGEKEWIRLTPASAPSGQS